MPPAGRASTTALTAPWLTRERCGGRSLVFEPLRCGYPWASDRLHAFVLQGMRDNARALASTRASTIRSSSARPSEGKGLLKRLSEDAAVVVTDDFPAFFLPR